MKKNAELDINAIWTRYRQKLRGYLRVRVGNDADVEDLLQEVLVKTFKNMHRVREPAKFQSWLFQTARHATIDYYRRKKVSVPLKDRAEEGPDQGYEGVRRELARCLRPFLKSVPSPYREAVEDADLKGLAQKERAWELGIGYSAFKSRVQRGRKMLHKLYKECCRYEVDVRGNILDYRPKKKCC